MMDTPDTIKARCDYAWDCCGCKTATNTGRKKTLIPGMGKDGMPLGDMERVEIYACDGCGKEIESAID